MADKNPFHVKDYRRWFVGETLLSVSAGMGLATMLLAVEIFDSVATAGLFFSVVSLLGILGSAVGGSLADSVQRRSLFKVFSPVVIICSLGIAITVSGYFYANWTTQAAVVAISSFVLISSAITGVLDPVMDEKKKNVISPEQFPRAVGAAEARESTISIAASPVSGALYSVLAPAPFVVQFFCNLGFYINALAIRTPLGPNKEKGVGLGDEKQTETQDSPPTGWWRNLTAKLSGGYGPAWRFLRERNALFRILLSSPLINLFVFGTFSWTTFYLSDAGEPGWLIGLVMAGFSISSLLGSALVPWFTDRYSPGLLVVVGLGSMLVFFAVFLFLAASPWVMLVVSLACMLPSPALNAALFGHVFAVTPQDLQGRVMAIFIVVSSAISVVVPTLAGTMVESGTRFWFAAVVIGTGIVGWLLLAGSREVRAMRNEEPDGDNGGGDTGDHEDPENL